VPVSAFSAKASKKIDPRKTAWKVFPRAEKAKKESCSEKTQSNQSPAVTVGLFAWVGKRKSGANLRSEKLFSNA